MSSSNDDSFYTERGETLAQVAWRDSGGSIPRNIQDQVGQGSEQPGLVEDVPACSRRVGLDDLQRSLPTQNVL